MKTTEMKTYYQIRAMRWAEKARREYGRGNHRDAAYYQGKARRWAKHARGQPPA
jgi:hypothetical protein